MHDTDEQKEKACLGCSCFLVVAFIVVVSVSSGGWHVTFVAGTDAQKCTHSHHVTDMVESSKFEDVCVNGGTEYSFSSDLDGFYNNSGIYRCACCGEPLFPASTKFDSGTGWPSYWAPVDGDKIGYSKDVKALFSTEVHCKKCGAHLGHVFGGVTGGGSGETNYRYCINGVCLRYDAQTQLPRSTDMPVTLDSYFIMFLVIAGPVSSCCLCGRVPAYLRMRRESSHVVAEGA